MCDSVGFIQPCHWTRDSDLGGYVRSPIELNERYVSWLNDYGSRVME